MRQKHYPLVTFLAAIALTVMPAGLLLLASRAGSAIDDPVVDDGLTEFAMRTTPEATETTDGAQDVLRSDPDRLDEVVEQPSSDQRLSENTLPDQQLTAGISASRESGSPAPVPEILPPSPFAAEAASPTSMSPIRPAEPVADILGVSLADTTLDTPVDTASPAATSMEGEDIVQMPATPAPAATFYEATGHPVLDERRTSGMPRPSAGASADAGKPRRQRRGDSRPQGSNSAAESAADDKQMVAMHGSAVPSLEDAMPQAQLEEVVLQRPLESRRVGRVEDVVGVTRARGWPIALVRSDIPGDEWWVQQMVGINGTTFAARVNFGNADSITGSGYRMIFVFLDSPEEVRRFRIAKQFKEIPEGVRRSREFQFIRE